MAPRFESYEHLLRLAALFVAGILMFVGLRWWMVPADYGRFGPYRAGAVAQIAALPVAYAGQAACLDCHSDVGQTRTGNAHAAISCETCHGPLATHASDPANPARKPDPRAICATCHRPDAAKPSAFKTVNVTEHADAGPCTACHPAHAPRTW